jgi:hypothetical protein
VGAQFKRVKGKAYAVHAFQVKYIEEYRVAIPVLWREVLIQSKYQVVAAGTMNEYRGAAKGQRGSCAGVNHFNTFAWPRRYFMTSE